MDAIKRLLRRIPVPITKNQWYDILTSRIIKNYVREDSNCIDIGCLEGDILRMFLKAAPQGTHYAFEPIPEYFQLLKTKFEGKAKILQMAVSNTSGVSEFNFVTSNPSYSGIRKRSYDRPSESIEKIAVKLTTLDDIIPVQMPVDLIKIDVEGAELFVFEGARAILERWHPALLFEHGKGGADSYGYGPDDVFNLLSGTHGYQFHTLSGWLRGQESLDSGTFRKTFKEGTEFYFFASYNKGSG